MAWKEEHTPPHRQVRARVEHVFARMKGWRILHDCRLKGDGVHHAMPGVARLHNLTSEVLECQPGDLLRWEAGGADGGT